MPPTSSYGPRVPYWKPRTENSPPTMKRSESWTQSSGTSLVSSSYVYAQLSRNGLMYQPSALRLSEVLRESLNIRVAPMVGLSISTVPPSGPPAYAREKLSREPRVGSNG